MKEKEEAMKEMLTQEVHTYVKFNDHSRDEPHQAITHFTVHLINVYKVRLVTLGVNSLFIILDCPTLGSLEQSGVTISLVISIKLPSDTLSLTK